MDSPFTIELPPDLPTIQVDTCGSVDQGLVGDHQVGHQDSDLSSTRIPSLPRNAKLVKKQRAVSEIDSPAVADGQIAAMNAADGGSVVTPEKFYQEVVKGQTFLGLGAFAFQPKPVRIRRIFSIKAFSLITNVERAGLY